MRKKVNRDRLEMQNKVRIKMPLFRRFTQHKTFVKCQFFLLKY